MKSVYLRLIHNVSIIQVFQNYCQKMLHSNFPYQPQCEIVIKRFFKRLCDLTEV
jgi:hypothetical protein